MVQMQRLWDILTRHNEKITIDNSCRFYLAACWPFVSCQSRRNRRIIAQAKASWFSFHPTNGHRAHAGNSAQGVAWFGDCNPSKIWHNFSNACFRWWRWHFLRNHKKAFVNAQIHWQHRRWTNTWQRALKPVNCFWLQMNAPELILRNWQFNGAKY